MWPTSSWHSYNSLYIELIILNFIVVLKYNIENFKLHIYFVGYIYDMAAAMMNLNVKKNLNR